MFGYIRLHTTRETNIPILLTSHLNETLQVITIISMDNIAFVFIRAHVDEFLYNVDVVKEAFQILFIISSTKTVVSSAWQYLKSNIQLYIRFLLPILLL